MGFYWNLVYIEFQFIQGSVYMGFTVSWSCFKISPLIPHIIYLYSIDLHLKKKIKNPFTKITDLCLNWHNTILIVVQVTYFSWQGSKVHFFHREIMFSFKLLKTCYILNDAQLSSKIINNKYHKIINNII
jgi:hypothetical protein